MPPKKKLRAEAAWEFEVDGKWTPYDATDAAMIEKEYVSKKATGSFITSNFTFNQGYGTMYTVDFTNMKQTNQQSNKVRGIRRVAGFTEVSWEYIDDNGLYVQFYDEDTNEIESLYRDNGLNAPAKTKKLSWNKGYNSMYTFTFTNETKDAAGAVVQVIGTQKNEDSGKIRQIKRTPKKLPWAVEGYGLSGDKDAAAQLKQFQAAAVASASASTPAPTPVVASVTTTTTDTPTSTTTTTQAVVVATPSPAAGFALIRAPTFALPPYWEKATLFDAVGGSHEVTLQHSSPKHKAEYDTVAKLLLDTIGKKVNIVHIIRLENAALYSFYAMTRAAIASGEAQLSTTGGKGTADGANEKMLFTGERIASNMVAIKKFGFDLRVAPADGAFGQGLYFGAQASFADNGRCIQNPDGSKDMLVCRVTVGNATVGAKSIRRPPPLDPKKPTMALYDSCTDGNNPPQTHILFNSKQVYAEYIVRYI